MQRSLSAIPGALLCPVFASYPAKRGIFMTKTPPFCQWLFCLCKHKQCIKSPQTRQINSSTSPFRFHADPGLHLLHTRISHVLPPGSEETFQVVFGKRTACLHEKTSLFNLFCISFRRYLEFDRRLTYNALLFLTMMVMIDE